MQMLDQKLVSKCTVLINHLNCIKIVLKIYFYILGAYYLQTAINKFQELLLANLPVENKTLDNVASILSNLYNFKVM